MTYIELLRIADQKLNNNEITLGEYEEMIKPLEREVIDKSVLEDIKAEIQKLNPNNVLPDRLTDYDYVMAEVFYDILSIIDEHIGKEKE